MRDEAFTFTGEYATEALRRAFDPGGPYGALVRSLNLPPSFVILNRITWGMSAVLDRLVATANWRRIVEELWPFVNGPPSTELGRLEADWLRSGGAGHLTG